MAEYYFASDQELESAIGDLRYGFVAYQSDIKRIIENSVNADRVARLKAESPENTADATTNKQSIQCLCETCQQSLCDGMYNRGSFSPKYIVSECNGYMQS